MLNVRIDPQLEARLSLVVKRTGRSKSFYVREALREKIEELEDIALLEGAMRDPDFGVRRYTLEEVKRELGLDD